MRSITRLCARQLSEQHVTGLQCPGFSALTRSASGMRTSRTHAHVDGHWRHHRPLARAVCAGLGLLLSSACGEDPVTRGSIQLRQIVAVVCDSPEVRPGQTMTVNALVADPTPSPFTQDYAVIQCTTYTDVTGCLEELEVLEEDDINLDSGEVILDEEDYREVIDLMVHRGKANPESLVTKFQADLKIPSTFAYFLEEYDSPQIDASFFVMMCNEGGCPIFDDIDAFLAQEPGALSGAEMLRRLSDPNELIAGAPLESAILGRKNYKVTFNAKLNHNPNFLTVDASDCLNLFDESTSTNSCALNTSLTSDSLEIYTYDQSTGTQTQEAVVVRYYTTLGSVSPYSVQIFPSSLYQSSSLLSVEPAHPLPESFGVFAVAVDSRGGMGVEGLLLPSNQRVTLP